MNKSKLNRKPITPTEYDGFQEAYDFFNAELFDASLPEVLITFQRKARTGGYFSPDRFKSRSSAKLTAHEIALNPDAFAGRTDEYIASILVHEMAHCWQEVHGSQSRRGYHNREWGDKMKEVGLQPTDTGEPGGKETGQKMAHFIIPNGPFAKTYKKLKARGWTLNWQSVAPDKLERDKAASKTKFQCSQCGQNAWGKPGTLLVCGGCYDHRPRTVVRMSAPVNDATSIEERNSLLRA